MDQSYHRQGEIVRDFLNDSDTSELPNEFFIVLREHTRTSVSWLLKKGWQLPENSNDARKDVHNTANYLMGLMLGINNGRKYCYILDYFEKHLPCIADPNPIDYFHLLTDFVRRFCPQYLTKLKKDENPQMAKLKRQIDRAISDSDNYCKDSCRFKGKSASVWRVANSENLRSDCDPIDFHTLLDIVEEAYYCGSNNAPEWLTNIFEKLSYCNEYQNFLYIHDLKSAMVAIRTKHIEESSIKPVNFRDTKWKILLKAGQKAQKQTIVYIQSEVISKYINKGRLVQHEADQFLRAVESYLADLSNGCETASIPTYLRETRLFDDNQVYLKKYKYMFETVIDESREKFIEIMKKDPTIPSDGDY
jgi:hypothetical protein